MPIYEYECQACDKIHEVTQRISDDPLTTCPDCKGSLKKLVSRSAFHLKGGGWYADGYTNGSANGTKAASCRTAKEAKSSKEQSPAESSGKSAAESSGKAACGKSCCCAAQSQSG